MRRRQDPRTCSSSFSVRRPIVYHDDFEVREGLREDGVQGLGDVMRRVVRGNNDTHCRVLAAQLLVENATPVPNGIIMGYLPHERGVLVIKTYELERNHFPHRSVSCSDLLR